MLSMNEQTIQQLKRELEKAEADVLNLRKKMVDWFSIPKKEGDALLAEHDRYLNYISEIKGKLRRAGWQG